ncbi:MAG: arginase family protein [Spirochaetales bacterium]|nr:arginase family protein [Spirochaetales bacterium]
MCRTARASLPITPRGGAGGTARAYGSIAASRTILSYEGDLAVVWFDAHADMNTLASSPSQTFHGMPLRVLMGEGERALRAAAYSTVWPDQVILAGVRDLDADEAAVIDRRDVALVSIDALGDPASISAAVRATGADNLYVHIDFDVLDPVAFPHAFVPTPNGLPLRALIDALGRLAERHPIVGASMVELAPGDAGAAEAVRELYDALSL